MTTTQLKYRATVMDSDGLADLIVQPGILDPKPQAEDLIRIASDHNTYTRWCGKNGIDVMWRQPLQKLIKLGAHPLYSCQGLDQKPEMLNEIYISLLWDDASPIKAIVDYLDKYLWYFLNSPHELNFERNKLLDRKIVTPMSKYTPVWKSCITIRYNPMTDLPQAQFFVALNYLLDRFIEYGDVPPFTYEEGHAYPIVNNAIRIGYSKIQLGAPEFICVLAHTLVENKIVDFSTDNMEVSTYLQMSGMFA